MNYYNYFTEIEEHFQRKRGAQIWISPVDWALIESWREAGIPLAAVLAGIDKAFEKYDSGRVRASGKLRSLVYCAAAVLDAAEAARQAAVGGHAEGAAAAPESEGFTRTRVAMHLEEARRKLAASPGRAAAAAAMDEVEATLDRLQAGLAAQSAAAGQSGTAAPGLQELDRVLSVLDEKLVDALRQATPVEVLVEWRAEMERELAPYRRKLRAEQFGMIERQFLHRRLLERAQLPRLSLFYMG